MPRILLLADSASPHIEKWAISLADNGYTVGLFSLNKSSNSWHLNNKNISLLYEPLQFASHSSLKIKLRYLSKLPLLFKSIKEFKPDIVHAHYATSYGLLGSLSGFRPLVLSVWGSDVFEFPIKSFFHKFIFKMNLKNSDQILSTSHAMKDELSNYTGRKINVTPFGVNTNIFKPNDVKNALDKQTLYIGTIKSIEERYGIGVIIDAIKILKNSFPELKFKVLLIGNGSKTALYEKLTAQLKMSDVISFTGKISTADVPFYHNLLDIFLNVSSVNESFGVSVIEAMSCGKPVIVTNAAGLTEIVKNNTGIIIKMNDPEELARAIKQLIDNPEKRKKLGNAARIHVKANYELDFCVKQMTNVYEAVLNEPFKKEKRFKILKALFS